MLIHGNICFGICGILAILAYPNYIKNRDSKTERQKKGFLCPHSLKPAVLTVNNLPVGKAI